MVYAYLINPNAPSNKAAGQFQTMRVGALTQEILDAKVAGYLGQGFKMASEDQVIADRGALIVDSVEEIAAEEEQEVNNGNTSVEAVEANIEAANPEAPIEEEAAPAEEVPTEEAPAEEAPAEEAAPVEEEPVV